MQKTTRWRYWIPTAFIVLLWTTGAIRELIQSETLMQVFRHLGYPDYFGRMLGTAQLLAVFAILAPVPATLREWAYAGLAFDAIAAMVSLVATGAPVLQLSFPVLALAMLLASHKSWRGQKRSTDVKSTEIPRAKMA